MPTTSDSPWTVDTNILVYATEPDHPGVHQQLNPQLIPQSGQPAKQRIARQLLGRLGLQEQALLVGQVVGEFVNVMLRKRAMSHLQASQAAVLLSRGARVLGASGEAYAQAWELVGKHKYQMWDALIIAICAEHGVKTLYSEDAGSLKRPLGVHVINPFAELELG